MSNNEFGPHKLDGFNIFYRTLAGTVGGAAGALLVLTGVLFFGQLLGQLEDGNDLFSPLIILAIVIVLFISALVANVLGAFLISLTDPDKYTDPIKAIYQVSIVNVVIFVCTIPVYFVTQSINASAVFYVAAMHYIFTALTSALVFEVIAEEKGHILLKIYSVILSIFIGIIFTALLYMLAQELILFFIIPILLWFSIGLIGGLVEYFYYQMYRRSGVDFLQTDDLSNEEYEGDEEMEA